MCVLLQEWEEQEKEERQRREREEQERRERIERDEVCMKNTYTFCSATITGNNIWLVEGHMINMQTVLQCVIRFSQFYPVQCKLSIHSYRCSWWGPTMCWPKYVFCTVGDSACVSWVAELFLGLPSNRCVHTYNNYWRLVASLILGVYMSQTLQPSLVSFLASFFNSNVH